jgi:hypothetical protein
MVKSLTRYCARHNGILAISGKCLLSPKPQITHPRRPLRIRKMAMSRDYRSTMQLVASLNYFLGLWTSHMIGRSVQGHRNPQSRPWGPAPGLAFFIHLHALLRAHTTCSNNLKMHPILLSYPRPQRGSRVDKTICQSPSPTTEDQTLNFRGAFASLLTIRLMNMLVRRCHET